MLNLNIICVGNLKEQFLKDFQNEYVKRLSKYVKIKIIELKESSILSFTNKELIKNTLEDEGIKILKNIKNSDFVILSDLHGKEEDSVSFSKRIDELKQNYSTIDFVIGSTLGIGENVRERANYSFALSQLTFTHQLTRIILLEQIYRAMKILNNESYHH